MWQIAKEWTQNWISRNGGMDVEMEPRCGPRLAFCINDNGSSINKKESRVLIVFLTFQGIEHSNSNAD
jgi:hypothetical protein